jgi:hypothetical protein
VQASLEALSLGSTEEGQEDEGQGEQETLDDYRRRMDRKKLLRYQVSEQYCSG